MRKTKLRYRPIAEQIAEYEREISNINTRIINGRKKQAELRRHIRFLSSPAAEIQYNERMEKLERKKDEERRRSESVAKKHERMARQVEECLRMNGKLI